MSLTPSIVKGQTRAHLRTTCAFEALLVCWLTMSLTRTLGFLWGGDRGRGNGAMGGWSLASFHLLYIPISCAKSQRLA